MVRYIFLVLGLTLFAEIASSQSLAVGGRPETAPAAERMKPAVNVQEQAGMPLRISSLKTKWATSDEQMLEIYTVVENVSDVAIRAYALRSGTADGVESTGACLLHSTQSPGKILRPGDSDSKSTWRRIPPDSPSSNIDLSLDFVEFANGSTWGIDACQSIEKLSGLRAGATAAKDKLAKMLGQNNDRALSNLLKLDAPILEPPEGHSAVWVESFQGGVRTLFERVKKANEEGGLPEAERVLRLPFDASETLPSLPISM